MSAILILLLIVLGVFAALAIGGGLLVLLAYGTGWLVNHLMGFDPFQATLITLLGICVFGVLAERFWQVVLATPSLMPDSDENEDDEDEFDEDEEEEPVIVLNPRLPRWRQPRKNVDFSNARPDDRCPCGSGRKYKNCHGAKQPK